MTNKHWRQLAIGLLGAIASPLVFTSAVQADRVIIHNPVIIREREPARRRVIVEFVALGDAWASVFIDGRRVFNPHNTNRRKRFRLREGAYDIKITGVDTFDVWAEGYLDVGRDNTNIIVVTFAETGAVRVSGDPYAWIPLSTTRRRR